MDILAIPRDVPACIDDLPADVLAGILALLPLSKSKVALQGVSHLWKTVLQMQSAHSIETKAQDQCLPPNPHLPLADGGVSKLAGGLLNALAYCETAAEDSLEWLPLSLKALKISGNQSLAACPRLPNLRELAIETDCGFSPACDINSLFPNVEAVCATTNANIDYTKEGLSYNNVESEMINQVMENIENLANLKHVKISSATIPDFYGPAECRVSVKKVPSAEDGDYIIPESMKSYLQYLNISIYDVFFPDGLHLGNFSDCSVLESICIRPGAVRDLFMVWELDGFKTLPAACKMVEIKLQHNSDFLPLPKVDLEDALGWQIAVTSVQHVVFTRI